MADIPVSKMKEKTPVEKQRTLVETEKAFSQRRRLEIHGIPPNLGPNDIARIMLRNYKHNDVFRGEDGRVHILFSSPEVASRAFRELKGKNFNDRPMFVCYSQSVFNLCVSNLPLDYTVSKLRTAMQRFGRIERLFIVHSESSAQSKGYGFVEFIRRNDANRAKQELKLVLNGQKVRVDSSNYGIFEYEHVHSQTLLVDNLSPDVTENDLKKLFEPTAKPTFCKIDSRRNTKYALFDFSSPKDAESVWFIYDGAILHLKPIHIMFMPPGRTAASLIGGQINKLPQLKNVPIPPFNERQRMWEYEPPVNPEEKVSDKTKQNNPAVSKPSSKQTTGASKDIAQAKANVTSSATQKSASTEPISETKKQDEKTNGVEVDRLLKQKLGMTSSSGKTSAANTPTKTGNATPVKPSSSSPANTAAKPQSSSTATKTTNNSPAKGQSNTPVKTGSTTPVRTPAKAQGAVTTGSKPTPGKPAPAKPPTSTAVKSSATPSASKVPSLQSTVSSSQANTTKQSPASKVSTISSNKMLPNKPFSTSNNKPAQAAPNTSVSMLKPFDRNAQNNNPASARPDSYGRRPFAPTMPDRNPDSPSSTNRPFGGIQRGIKPLMGSEIEKPEKGTSQDIDFRNQDLTRNNRFPGPNESRWEGGEGRNNEQRQRPQSEWQRKDSRSEEYQRNPRQGSQMPHHDNSGPKQDRFNLRNDRYDQPHQSPGQRSQDGSQRGQQSFREDSRSQSFNRGPPVRPDQERDYSQRQERPNDRPWERSQLQKWREDRANQHQGQSHSFDQPKNQGPSFQNQSASYAANDRQRFQKDQPYDKDSNSYRSSTSDKSGRRDFPPQGNANRFSDTSDRGPNTRWNTSDPGSGTDSPRPLMSQTDIKPIQRNPYSQSPGNQTDQASKNTSFEPKFNNSSSSGRLLPQSASNRYEPYDNRNAPINQSRNLTMTSNDQQSRDVPPLVPPTKPWNSDQTSQQQYGDRSNQTSSYSPSNTEGGRKRPSKWDQTDAQVNKFPSTNRDVTPRKQSRWDNASDTPAPYDNKGWNDTTKSSETPRNKWDQSPSDRSLDKKSGGNQSSFNQRVDPPPRDQRSLPPSRSEQWNKPNPPAPSTDQTGANQSPRNQPGFNRPPPLSSMNQQQNQRQTKWDTPNNNLSWRNNDKLDQDNSRGNSWNNEQKPGSLSQTTPRYNQDNMTQHQNKEQQKSWNENQGKPGWGDKTSSNLPPRSWENNQNKPQQSWNQDLSKPPQNNSNQNQPPSMWNQDKNKPQQSFNNQNQSQSNWDNRNANANSYDAKQNTNQQNWNTNQNQNQQQSTLNNQSNKPPQNRWHPNQDENKWNNQSSNQQQNQRWNPQQQQNNQTFQGNAQNKNQPGVNQQQSSTQNQVSSQQNRQNQNQSYTSSGQPQQSWNNQSQNNQQGMNQGQQQSWNNNQSQNAGTKQSTGIQQQGGLQPQQPLNNQPPNPVQPSTTAIQPNQQQYSWNGMPSARFQPNSNFQQQGTNTQQQSWNNQSQTTSQQNYNANWNTNQNQAWNANVSNNPPSTPQTTTTTTTMAMGQTSTSSSSMSTAAMPMGPPMPDLTSEGQAAAQQYIQYYQQYYQSTMGNMPGFDMAATMAQVTAYAHSYYLQFYSIRNTSTNRVAPPVPAAPMVSAPTQQGTVPPQPASVPPLPAQNTGVTKPPYNSSQASYGQSNYNSVTATTTTATASSWNQSTYNQQPSSYGQQSYSSNYSGASTITTTAAYTQSSNQQTGYTNTGTSLYDPFSSNNTDTSTGNYGNQKQYQGGYQSSQQQQQGSSFSYGQKPTASSAPVNQANYGYGNSTGQQNAPSGNMPSSANTNQVC